MVVGLTVLIADWLVACADDSATFLLTLFRCRLFFTAVVVVIAVFYFTVLK